MNHFAKTMNGYCAGMTISNVFTPLSARRGKRPKSFFKLESGVPDYMFPLLRDWLLETDLFYWQSTIHGKVWYFTSAGRELLLFFKMKCETIGDFWRKLQLDRGLLLDALDYCLHASFMTLRRCTT